MLAFFFLSIRYFIIFLSSYLLSYFSLSPIFLLAVDD